MKMKFRHIIAIYFIGIIVTSGWAWHNPCKSETLGPFMCTYGFSVAWPVMVPTYWSIKIWEK